MAKLRASTETLETRERRQVCRVALSGIISTPTIAQFRHLMREPIGLNRDVLVDLSEVSYVNSSGLGELVGINDELGQAGLALMVINTDPEMARLIQMLGLTSVLRVYTELETALAALDSGFREEDDASAAVAVPQVQRHERGSVSVPIVPTPPPRLPDARIVLGINADMHFARFLGRCLTGNGGNTVVVNKRSDVQAALAAGRVDLAVIDSALPESEAMCADLKTHAGNGILSVIFIYPSITAREGGSLFRVAEDEFVVEPFEVREMVAMAQTEFARCKTESLLFVQEACLELCTKDDAINQAYEILERMIASAGLPQEAADGFAYAIREAVDNARRHGNVSDPDKAIEVLYVLDKEKVMVTVGDEGKGFDFMSEIKRAREQTPLEQARIRHAAGGYGGLGIGLMLRCTDRLEYLPPGNIVKLTKYL